MIVVILFIRLSFILSWWLKCGWRGSHSLNRSHAILLWTHFSPFSLFVWCYADETLLPVMAQLTKFLLWGSSEIWFSVPEGNKNGRRRPARPRLQSHLGERKRREVGWFPIRQSNNLTAVRWAIISPQDQIKLREAYQHHLGWKPTDLNSHKIQKLLAFMSRCHTMAIRYTTENISSGRISGLPCHLYGFPPHSMATAPLSKM